MALEYFKYITTYGNTIVDRSNSSFAPVPPYGQIYIDYFIPQTQPLYLYRNVGGSGGTIVVNTQENIDNYLNATELPPTADGNVTYGQFTGTTTALQTNKVNLSGDTMQGKLYFSIPSTDTNFGSIGKNDVYSGLDIRGLAGLSLNTPYLAVPQWSGFTGAQLSVGAGGLITLTTAPTGSSTWTTTGGTNAIVANVPEDLGIVVSPTQDVAAGTVTWSVNFTNNGNQSASVSLQAVLNSVAYPNLETYTVGKNQTSKLSGTVPISTIITSGSTLDIRILSNYNGNVNSSSLSISKSGNVNVVWGNISGSIANQTDLQAALNTKVNKSGDNMTGTLNTSSNLTANGMVSGSSVYGSVWIHSPIISGTSCVQAPITCGKTCVVSPTLCATTAIYEGGSAISSKYASKTNAITGATNLGTATPIYTSVSGNKIGLKSLSGGSGISISNTANAITICSTATPFNWSGSTANGVGTYVSATCIKSNPNMTFNGSSLSVTGNILASTYMCSPIITGSTKVCSPNIYATTSFYESGTALSAKYALKSTAITGATNFGTATPIYTSVSANKIQLKSLSGGSGISISNTANAITICSTVSAFNWSGSTANGVGTYVSATCVKSNPNMTFNGSSLSVIGNILASTYICSPIITGSTKICSPIIIGTSCVSSPIICASSCMRSPLISGGTLCALTSATAPTPAVNNSSTCIATTAWYFGQAGRSNPSMDGIAASGSSTCWARQDHVHPSNTSKQDTITGGATTITTANLTINRALISNASGKVAVSPTTSTQIGYLSGATSDIQTQINATYCQVVNLGTDYCIGSTNARCITMKSLKPGSGIAMSCNVNTITVCATGVIQPISVSDKQILFASGATITGSTNLMYCYPTQLFKTVNATLTNALNVSGATVLGSTSRLVGATTAVSTLNVCGATVFNSTAKIIGATTGSTLFLTTTPPVGTIQQPTLFWDATTKQIEAKILTGGSDNYFYKECAVSTSTASATCIKFLGYSATTYTAGRYTIDYSVIFGNSTSNGVSMAQFNLNGAVVGRCFAGQIQLANHSVSASLSRDVNLSAGTNCLDIWYWASSNTACVWLGTVRAKRIC